MKNTFDYFVSPVSHKPLTVNNGFLTTEDGSEEYNIQHGIPFLLPTDVNPSWDRELIEAIFWQYPEIIAEMKTEMRNRRRRRNGCNLHR